MEGEAAVDAYIFLWEKEYGKIADAESKKIFDLEMKSASANSWKMKTATFSILGEESKAFVPTLEVKSLDSPPPLGRSLSQILNSVVVPLVKGEEVEDVIGILISGIRMKLMNHKGDCEKLEQAAKYGENANLILQQHGSKLVNFSSICSLICQWLGVVYGELALEVRDSAYRQQYQNLALKMLKRAKKTSPKADPFLLYQLALQQAEVGQVLRI